MTPLSSRAPLLTVITLCRDNPQQLKTTLASLPAAFQGNELSWELLVLDGSSGAECGQIAQEAAHRFALPLRLEQRPPRGIYAAMNEALQLSQGRLLAFMNAGDRYVSGGLTSLIQHWSHQGQPSAVFGQAWIQPAHGDKPWLTPDPAMRHLDRWLKAMVPCHQAFLFDGEFARHHPYARGSLISDRAVMRAALAAAGTGAYLPQPVCFFDLSGASSRLPDYQELGRRFQDPQRSWSERSAELIKWILGPLVGSRYPRLMRWRSMLWGRLCG